VPLGIDEFLDYGLDPLGRLLQALLETSELADRRQLIGSYAAEMTRLAADTMTEEDVDVLERLRSGEEDVTLEGLRSLKAPAHKTLIDHVRKLAIKPGDETVQVAAIDALVEACGGDAVSILEEVATSPGLLLVRAEAALALRSLRDQTSAEAIERVRIAISGDRSMSALFVD
jgi:hypothetical protein